jgi:putative transposase
MQPVTARIHRRWLCPDIGSSSRPYKGLSDLEYPFHDRTITVSNCGRTCIGRRKMNLSTVFAGENVRIEQVSEKVWLVSLVQYDLGFFDHETDRVTSAENPFRAKVLPGSTTRGSISSEIRCVSFARRG